MVVSEIKFVDTIIVRREISSYFRKKDGTNARQN
jgi:hypothetical protein